MRRSMLLVGIAYAALYVTASFAFEARLSGKEVQVNPTSVLGNSDGVSGAARSCTGCHVLTQAENSVGPYLVGVVDRPAGAVSGYSYSDAMRRAEIRWTRERLREFLVDPQAVVPGTAMPSAPIDEHTADAIVNYLSRQH